MAAASTRTEAPATVSGGPHERSGRTAPPGEPPAAELSDVELEVFGLLRAHIGGAVAETVATGVGLSVEDATSHLAALESRGLVRCAETQLLWGFGTVVEPVWSLDLTEQCVATLECLPWRPLVTDPPTRVPSQFWCLFWSGIHPAELRLPEDALEVAARLLDSSDIAARCWALTQLPVEALQELRTIRGYTEGETARSLDAAIRHRLDA